MGYEVMKLYSFAVVQSCSRVPEASLWDFGTVVQ